MPLLNLVQRSQGLVDILAGNTPGVGSFRFASAVSLNAAYAGATSIFDVIQGRRFLSRTLALQRRGYVEENTRDMTRATFNPDDFASLTVPGDSVVSYMRAAPVSIAGVVGAYGPILVVPPPGFFTASRNIITLSGTAPNVAATPNATPPPTSMWISLPRYADQIRVYNDGANPIAIAFGAGQQEIALPNAVGGSDIVFQQSGVSQIFIRAQGGTSAFRISASLVNGSHL
jgi:hypothetical protein